MRAPKSRTFGRQYSRISQLGERSLYLGAYEVCLVPATDIYSVSTKMGVNKLHTSHPNGTSKFCRETHKLASTLANILRSCPIQGDWAGQPLDCQTPETSASGGRVTAQAVSETAPDASAAALHNGCSAKDHILLTPGGDAETSPYKLLVINRLGCAVHIPPSLFRTLIPASVNKPR
ncbi:hypothetical protein BC628DRAFT_1362896, partial [Trametes gibbosa]